MRAQFTVLINGIFDANFIVSRNVGTVEQQRIQFCFLLNHHGWSFESSIFTICNHMIAEDTKLYDRDVTAGAAFALSIVSILLSGSALILRCFI